MRKSKPNYINKLASSTKLIGPMSVGTLALIGITTLFPITSPDSNALTNTTAYAESRVAVQAAASVSLSLDQNVEIPVTPSSEGTFGMNSAKLKVATNNEEGYKIFLTTSNGKSTLTNTDINKTGTGYEIDSITSDTVGTAFTGNTWGYALSDAELSANSTYKAVPTSLTSIYNKTTASVGGEDNYNLAFGTHISTSLAAGEYSNSVIVSVVANPQTISTLSELVYMQDMNSNICSNTASAYKGEGVDPDRTSPYYLSPVTKQLVDVRDGKRYWVAKLADGNCWMTQNLALDLDPAKPLTPSDSDVTANWAPTAKTEMEIPAKSDNRNLSTTRSWNLGKIIALKPTEGQGCHQPLPDDLKDQGYVDNDNEASAYHGYSLADTCSDLYRNVTTLTDGFSATEISSISSDGTSYDAHYLTGNYYQWNTAAAGTGLSGDAENLANGTSGLTDKSKLIDAKNSICPANWRLPVSGLYSQTVDSTKHIWPFERPDSLYNLIYAYGYPQTGSNTSTSIGWRITGSFTHTSLTGDGRIRADYKPIYLMRAGAIYPTTGAVQYAGNSGMLWSSTLYPNDDASSFNMIIDSSSIRPAYKDPRVVGYPIRCIAR